MADKEDKTPDEIKKHKKLYDASRLLIDTATHVHSKAYNSAAEKHLMNEDGKIDYNLLEDSKVQEQFVDTMADMYVTQAQKDLKVFEKKDNKLGLLERDLLMKAYTGTTTHQLRESVRKNGKKFTGVAHLQEALQNYIPELQQNLYASAGQHFSDGNIEDIIRYIGIDKRVDANKIQLQQAKSLLQEYHDEGTINKSELDRLAPNARKKEKKKK